MQVWEHAALQSEFMVGHQSSDDFDPELCYRSATVVAQQSFSNPTAYANCTAFDAITRRPSPCHDRTLHNERQLNVPQQVDSHVYIADCR